VPWIRLLVAGLSPGRWCFEPGSVHVVDKIARGQVFLLVLRISLSISFHRGSPYSYMMLEMNNRPAGVRSSETSSQPIDMNNNLFSYDLLVSYDGEYNDFGTRLTAVNITILEPFLRRWICRFWYSRLWRCVMLVWLQPTFRRRCRLQNPNITTNNLMTFSNNSLVRTNFFRLLYFPSM
jgi:hypothetical protein